MRTTWCLAAVIALGMLAGPGVSAEVFATTGGQGDGLGPSPCFCGYDPDVEPFCSTEVICAGLEECATNDDCQPGFRCLVANCCPGSLGGGACVPLCGDDIECSNPGVCDTFEECEPPLVVELESFEATWENGVVALTWTTASEFENAGFRIFRARRDGARIRKGGAESRELELSLELVTKVLVPAQGDPVTGASYRYADGAPHRPGTVSYYLVDVDYSGAATLHGPVHVEIPKPAPDTGGRSR